MYGYEITSIKAIGKRKNYFFTVSFTLADYGTLEW